MSLNNAAETALLKLLLQNVAWANFGDATGLRGSTTPGVVYVGLHTADPGEAGNPTSNEATFIGYARASIARDTDEWTVTNDTATNTNELAFAPCTAGSSTVTHFSISDASSGAGNWMLSGALGAPLNISAGITPRFAPAALTVTAS
jgi:hypothetical protein